MFHGFFVTLVILMVPIPMFLTVFFVTGLTFLFIFCVIDGLVMRFTLKQN